MTEQPAPAGPFGHSPRTRLPAPSTPLFGRDSEVQTISRLLDESRLVTVIGQGGVGKTRVAVEAAARQQRRVVFVSLAEVDRSGVAATIARACAAGGSNGPPGRGPLWPPPPTIFGGESVLLVLDTFEHVTDEVAVVGQLMSTIDNLASLVTSRRRLGRRDEVTVPLTGLSTTPGGSAAAMFWERSRAIGGGRHTGEAEQHAADELCRLLSGVPLAIELAAARTALLPPTSLLARMRLPGRGRLLGLLARGPVDMPGRQASMRATLSWSYQLLDAPTQLLFRRLGVFPGSFGLAAAEQVCADGGSNGQGSLQDDLLDAIEVLVEQHLLEPVRVPGDRASEARFTLPDVPRAFAGDLLESTGEGAAMRRRLSDWCLDFAHRADRGMASVDEPVWLNRIEAEMPLIRHTLAGLAQEADAARGVSLATGIAAYWAVRGPLGEATDWLRTFLELDRPQGRLPHQLRALAHSWLGRLALESGEAPNLERAREARAAVVRSPCSTGIWLRCTDHLLAAFAMSGIAAETLPLIREGLDRARATDDTYWVAAYLWRRAMHEWAQGHLDRGEQALPYAQEALAVAEQGGHQRLAARTRSLIAWCLMAERDWAGAYLTMQTTAAGLRASGDGPGLAVALTTIGAILIYQGEPMRAADYLSQGLHESRRTGYGYGEFFGVWAVTFLAAHSGRSVDATLMADALAPRLRLLEQILPAVLLGDFASDIEQARRAEAAGARSPGNRSLGRGWGWLRSRALELATELATPQASVVVSITAGSAPPSVIPAGAPVAAPAARSQRATRPGELTARELQILSAIASGRTNAQIAADLFLSAKTVMHHSTNIYRKLAVGGRAEAVALAYRTGLLQSPVT
jgi:predicted ATPase/DNA-binding CsgD family transcriptional regulator